MYVSTGLDLSYKLITLGVKKNASLYDDRYSVYRNDDRFLSRIWFAHDFSETSIISSKLTREWRKKKQNGVCFSFHNATKNGKSVARTAMMTEKAMSLRDVFIQVGFIFTPSDIDDTL